jgi:hypothetical protein
MDAFANWAISNTLELEEELLPAAAAIESSSPLRRSSQSKNSAKSSRRNDTGLLRAGGAASSRPRDSVKSLPRAGHEPHHSPGVHPDSKSARERTRERLAQLERLKVVPKGSPRPPASIAGEKRREASPKFQAAMLQRLAAPKYKREKAKVPEPADIREDGWVGVSARRSPNRGEGPLSLQVRFALSLCRPLLAGSFVARVRLMVCFDVCVRSRIVLPEHRRRSKN